MILRPPEHDVMMLMKATLPLECAKLFYEKHCRGFGQNKISQTRDRLLARAFGEAGYLVDQNQCLIF